MHAILQNIHSTVLHHLLYILYALTLRRELAAVPAVAVDTNAERILTAAAVCAVDVGTWVCKAARRRVSIQERGRELVTSWLC